MLGLQPTNLRPPPSLASGYIIFHFIFAYGILSSRTMKQYYGIDHNVSPREDLVKYGPEAVKSGKITQKQLDRLKRNEGAHANSVEHFPLFVGAMIWAHLTGLSTVSINGTALVYTVARLVYATVYVFVDRPAWSQMRGIAWWMSNIACLRLFWLGGKALNAKPGLYT